MCPRISWIGEKQIGVGRCPGSPSRLRIHPAIGPLRTAHPPDARPPRKATGEPAAQDRFCLGLLPFGPDPVHSRPLHRTRPPSAAATRSTAVVRRTTILGDPPILRQRGTSRPAMRARALPRAAGPKLLPSASFAYKPARMERSLRNRLTFG